MPLAQVHGVVLSGVRGAMVQVEVDVANGLPSVGVVGLPDTSVTEARWRTRSAISSAGGSWPDRRVTISLSPAEVRKNGAGLDLPIAIGVLAASEQLGDVDLRSTTFLGELGLDGRLRPTRGALAGALAARAAGLARLIVPPEAAPDVARVPGLSVIAARDLAQVVSVLQGSDPGEGIPPWPRAPTSAGTTLDLLDVRGHDYGRFALEVAAAGGHHLSLIGPPGVGKTLLAERLPGLLPDLAEEPALEVAAIHSVAGVPREGADFGRPPFQAPHHSASAAALLGAVHGSRVVPGAVTLAHHGVLFLDEAPEFTRPALEGLRQPMESGQVWLSRSGWAGLLPARFQLVLASNPCPCGHRVGRGSDCSCPPQAIRRYAARLSGPLVDRIDVRVVLTRPLDVELDRGVPGEPTSTVRARVAAALERARARLAGFPWPSNASIPTGELRRRFLPDAGGAELLRDLERRSLNLRGPDRILRVAWTVADLGGVDRPGRDEVGQAIGLRGVGG